jgi:hypothetical protein
MVLALYVLAGVMVAGGLTAIYSGSDIIVMERGWTMVIAGSVMAASGALLGGIATAVARLQNIQNEFTRLGDRLARAQAPSFASMPDIIAERGAPDQRPTAPPLAAFPEIREHRDLDITPEPVLSAPAPVERPAGPLPDEIPPPMREPTAIVREREEPVPELEPEPDTPPAEASAEPPPTIVGTYNSGGNFYIMYSDGSIEAETPAGKFRFNSLDELKEFIAAGGDKAKATS